jgi:DNA primase
MSAASTRSKDIIQSAMIEEARSRRPLSVVIGLAVALRKAGTEMVGLCPFHEDHNPSLNVNDRKGLWLCRSCSAGGDAITFVKRYYRKTFIEAVKELANAPQDTCAARFERQIRQDAEEYAATTSAGGKWEPSAEQRTNMAEARRLWARGVEARGTLGQTYLRSRGITLSPPKCLRFLASEPFWQAPEGKDRAIIVGHHPVLLASVQARNGDIIAVQRIYLRDDGSGKALYERPKKVPGPMQDGAVRLGVPARIMGIAEGVETALSAIQLFSVPVWATLGHKRLAAIAMPPEVEQLIIFADNGNDGKVDPVAMKAAEEYDHRGVAVVIEAPEGVKDWNDELRARKGIAA